jgi:hypothetical protein
MSWIEEMAVSILLGVLHQVVKNPAKAAAVKAAMLGLADEIYASFGVTPPTHS